MRGFRFVIVIPMSLKDLDIYLYMLYEEIHKKVSLIMAVKIFFEDTLLRTRFFLLSYITKYAEKIVYN